MSQSPETAAIEAALKKHPGRYPVEHLHSGKVREIFAVGSGKLVLVSTDRISAYDVVMKERVPGKGAVLNKLSAFWFNLLKDEVPHHLWSPNFLPNGKFASRTSLVERLTPIPLECIVRALITGSMWSAFEEAEAVDGIKTVLGFDLPATLLESEMFPKPLFTPSTKAEIGHDQNLTEAETRALLKEWTRSLPDEQRQHWADRDLFDELRDLSLKLFGIGSDYAAERGIILADTKFEFGLNPEGEIVLMDEVFTPDSSRFVFEEDYVVGEKLVCRDKQILRDYLQKLVDEGKWNKEYPAPELPQYLIDEIESTYKDMFRRIVGQGLAI